MNTKKPVLRKLLKKFLPLLLVLVSFQSTNAQPLSPLMAIDSSLHRMFQYVSNPNPTINFLYDLSGHMISDDFYSTSCPDTGNTDNWYMLYGEVYHMAYDTTGIPSDTVMYFRAQPRVDFDTIPMGILDIDFNRLTANALTSGTYFIFDTVNDLLYDQPSRPSAPYTIEHLFNASPLTESYGYLDPIFLITPDLILQNTQPYGDGTQLHIDFGDGSGDNIVDASTANTYYIHYPGAGKYTITTTIYRGTTLLKKSYSSLVITGNNQINNQPLIRTKKTHNLYTAEYGPVGCTPTDGSGTQMSKYLVYIGGIDVLGNRSPQSIYADMISSDSIAQLLNYGYKVFTATWANSLAPMEDNAQNIVEYLSDLKLQNAQECSCDNPPPMVVIGESMGGVIARWALKYMETSAYTSNTHHFAPQLMHNTRLFITVDAPMQGANIPLGYQHLYNFFANNPGIQSIFHVFNMDHYLQLLNGTSTRELLKYHVETDTHPGNNISSSDYTASSKFTNFYNTLNAMGYPQYLKKVALSNGSFYGRDQQYGGPYGPFRTPNDYLLDGYMTNNVKIMGRTVTMTLDSIQAQTDPIGTGRVFHAEHIAYKHWIHLFWFGWTIRQSIAHHVVIDKTATNMQPMDTRSGSNLALDAMVPGSFALPDWIGDLFGVRFAYNNGGNNLTLDLSIGNWIVSNNTHVGIHTDGFSFNFIPTASSMDYQLNDPTDLAHNFLSDGIDTTLAHTPYDVLMPNSSDFNQQHLTLQNPPLGLCQTCIANTLVRHSYLINREIGDDSLLLFNTHDAIVWKYEAERDILVDYYGPYYSYPSYQQLAGQPFSYTSNNYVLSKEAPCQFSSNPYNPTHLKANYTVTENSSLPHTGFYTIDHGTMGICCDNYSYKQTKVPTLVNNASSYLKVYPNPVSSGNAFTVNYRFKDNLPVRIVIYDIRGAVVMANRPTYLSNISDCFYQVTLPDEMASGVYFIKVTNGKETANSKLVVNPN